MQKTREQAWNLLNEYTKKDALIQHAICVESAMRVYAKKYNENVELWGITGLLHDFDYEKYPDLNEHPLKGSEILKEKEYPDELIKAILGHSNHTGIRRETKMSKTLFAVDELCGFIIAVAYVRPDKLNNMTAKSVKKKLKNIKFAEKVSREDIENGIIDLEVDRDEHIQFVIDALIDISDKLNL